MNMLSYIDAIGQYFPDAKVHCVGNGTDYNSIVWETTQISQADLDAVILIDYKTVKILEFSEYAKEEIVAGFNSDALGYPHFYDSDADDQLNLIGAVTTNSDMPYSCRPLTQGYQIVDVGGAILGTDATGFANDTTTYDAEVQVDGVSVYVSVVGQNAQTYDALITQIQADLDLGTEASTVTIVNGNIEFKSASYGNTSTINIVDATLLSSLTQFVAINTAVAGLSGVEVLNKVYKQHTHAQLLQVINDGKDVKLAALQKFNVKRAQISEAVDKATVDAIVWE